MQTNGSFDLIFLDDDDVLFVSSHILSGKGTDWTIFGVADTCGTYLKHTGIIALVFLN